MNPAINDSVGEAARLWAIRLKDPGFDDWDGFTAWLEAAPEHNPAYETALAADDRLADLFTTTTPAPRIAPLPIAPPARRPRWHWAAGGGAMAAALALVVSWTMLGQGSAPYAIETAPGQTRAIALADGSRILLNGGTRVTLDEDEPRMATLDRGEALFEVRHDERDPFVVTAGAARLVDAGTVFNVVHDAGELRVGVSEGAVIYQPDAAAIRLGPGESLSVRGQSRPEVGRIAIESVGGWRSGQLVYAGAPLGQIARDLTRTIGRPVRAAPGAEQMRFSGILAIRGDADAELARVASLLGATARRDAEGWTLAPADAGVPADAGARR